MCAPAFSSEFEERRRKADGRNPILGDRRIHLVRRASAISVLSVSHGTGGDDKGFFLKGSALESFEWNNAAWQTHGDPDGYNNSPTCVDRHS